MALQYSELSPNSIALKREIQRIQTSNPGIRSSANDRSRTKQPADD